MRNRDYITSERFIHDDLAERAEAIAEQARNNWRQAQKLDTVAISWPSEHLTGDDGSTITHAVVMPLDDKLSQAEQQAALQLLVTKTKAYGLVLVERRDEEIRVLFETHHGARAWITPLKRHGDVRVAGRTRVHDNAECLGFLWRPEVGVS